MKKALQNIPRTDDEKLAIFYGTTKAPKEEKQKPARSTEVKSTTLDKVELIREQLRPLLTFAQEAVYIELFKRSQGQVTDWVGYQEIARETKVSTKTVKRSIDEMVNKGLIKKVDFLNNREMKGSKYQLFLPENIETKILLIRNKKVMMDSDLATCYGVETKVLLQTVKRNKERFPEDFMFQLTKQEVESLRSQIVTSRRGGRRYLPYCFTEQGVAMLSSVLRSKRAIHMNIAIMRAFVKLREIISTHKELAHKLKELERKVGNHDEAIQTIFDAIRELMLPPAEKPKQKIGFHVK